MTDADTPLTPVATEPLTSVAAEPLTVVATLEAKPGQEAALEQALRALLLPTRAEQGCVTYDLHRSAETPGLFVFHETWSSRPLWEAHMRSPHLQAFGAQQEALVARWELFAGAKL